MIYQKLSLKNFMSFHNETFSDLDRKGLTLVNGENHDEGESNGSGKSSLWDGISFALFGHTVRGLKGDEVVHRKFKKECEVRVDFEFKGQSWAVVRTRKPDRFYVEVDGKVTELGTSAMTQQWLIDTLEIDYDLFRSTVVFAQGETFNFVNSTNKEQKEMLSKIMRISYEVRLNKAKAKIKDLKEKKSEVDRQLSVLASHVVEGEEFFSDEIEEWETNRTARIERKKNEARDIKKKLEGLKDGDASEMGKQLKENTEKIEQIRLRSADYVTKAADLRAEVKQAQKYLDSAEDLMKAPECPTCGHAIDGLDLADKLRHVESEMEVTKSELLKWEEKVTLSNQGQDKLSKSNHDLRNKIMVVQMATSQRELLTEAVSDLVEEVKSIKTEENPWFKKRVAELIKQKDIKAKMTAFERTKESVDAMIPYVDFWVNAFGDSGIKSFVFDLVCATLTTRANYYLNILTSGKVIVTFDTQKKTKSGEVREKFDCEILVDGVSVKYDSYSGGEKRRISLAVDLALSDLMSDYYVQSFNIVVMDEQDSFLDRQGRAAYLNLLKEMAKTKHVFVVAHDTEFKATFDDVIVIQKKDGISAVV